MTFNNGRMSRAGTPELSRTETLLKYSSVSENEPLIFLFFTWTVIERVVLCVCVFTTSRIESMGYGKSVGRIVPYRIAWPNEKLERKKNYSWDIVWLRLLSRHARKCVPSRAINTVAVLPSGDVIHLLPKFLFYGRWRSSPLSNRIDPCSWVTFSL